MDTTALSEHIAEAEAQIAHGEQHILKLREQIVELQHAGQETDQALEMLVQAEKLQALYIADRDRLTEELRLEKTMPHLGDVD